MPCYSPIIAYRSREVNKSGKRSLVFSLRTADPDIPPETIPCGQCLGCRLERSRQWAIRCVHEASLYDSNCFITLTMSDDWLDKPISRGLRLEDCWRNANGSLIKRDFVLFMKRLRKRFGAGIRFFHCGEYGELTGRPHHHVCLFNFDFPDKCLYSIRDGVRLYRSPILEDLWPFGFCTIGDVTFESAAYVARYVMKKVTGSSGVEHYGERLPEYITMSRRPGIGRDWYRDFASDVYPHDRMVIRGGVVCRPPKYYDSLFALDNVDVMSILKEERMKRGKALRGDMHPCDVVQRLRVKGKVKLAQLSQLKRGL
nr:MAG: replication initiator protein [Microvirus sp.]